MKLLQFLPVAAVSMLIVSPALAASKAQLCPSDLASAKATSVALSMTGEPKRTPSSGYERVTYDLPNITRVGRPVQKIVVERSANVSKGTGHYLLSFFAPGTAKDLITLLTSQLPAAKCEPGFCSGSAAILPGAEGSLEYGSVDELDGGKSVVFRCKYRDNDYGRLMMQGG